MDRTLADRVGADARASAGIRSGLLSRLRRRGTRAAPAARRAHQLDQREAAARRRGFTLVELMGVTLVLMLVASITFVSWRATLPRAQRNAAIRRLASTLHETRSNAIARNAQFEIVYDLNEHRYWIRTPFRPGGGLAAFDDERLITGETYLPAGVEFQQIVIDGQAYVADLVTVRFDPLGAASDHTITLVQNPYDVYYTIEVLALTGLIRFHDGQYVRPYPDEKDFE